MGKIIEWFLVTIIIGLIPVGMKLFICLFDGNGFFQNITALDHVVWGFIVNLNIINEREGRFKPLFSSSEKIANFSKLPIVFVVFYVMMYTYGLKSDGLQSNYFNGISVILSITTLAVCVAYNILHYCFVVRKENIEIEGEI